MGMKCCFSCAGKRLKGLRVKGNVYRFSQSHSCQHIFASMLDLHIKLQSAKVKGGGGSALPPAVCVMGMQRYSDARPL